MVFKSTQISREIVDTSTAPVVPLSVTIMVDIDFVIFPRSISEHLYAKILKKSQTKKDPYEKDPFLLIFNLVVLLHNHALSVLALREERSRLDYILSLLGSRGFLCGWNQILVHSVILEFVEIDSLQLLCGD